MRKFLFILLYPVAQIIRLLQNKTNLLYPYQVLLMISWVLRIVRSLNGTDRSVQVQDTFYTSDNPSGNMKTGFIGHSHHYKTVSSLFFIRLLQQYGTVKVMWDSQWNGGKFRPVDQINKEEFDILVIWQVMIYHHPAKLKRLKCKNIIIIPMYDDIHAVPDKFFMGYRDYRFISFCRDLQKRFDGLSIRSKYFRFFIDPSSLPYHDDSFTELKGFFWQRTNDITWEQIRKLIEGSSFSGFHLHLALDPIWYQEVLPSDEEIEKYHITITRWFDKKEDYLSVLSKANVFFTPRLYEGIGMPVIEAMAMGKLVVSPDHPTMNEYIIHGKNGLLYNEHELKPLDFSHSKSMSVQARTECFTGFEKWQQAGADLSEWIKGSSQ